MFSHIYSDSICVDKTSIDNIINKGNTHILNLKDQFSATKMNALFTEIINTISEAR